MELHRFLGKEKRKMFAILATESVLKNLRYVQGKLAMIEKFEQFLKEQENEN